MHHMHAAYTHIQKQQVLGDRYHLVESVDSWLNPFVHCVPKTACSQTESPTCQDKSDDAKMRYCCMQSKLHHLQQQQIGRCFKCAPG